MEAFKPKISIALSWPTPQDYNEAVQNPVISFSDPDLAGAAPKLDALGLPRVASGMFASVYCLESKPDRWAVRCFLRHIPETHERYAEIESALQTARLKSAVQFDIQETGIRIHGQWYPILKMQWCEGLTLTTWLDEQRRNKAKLDRFLSNWIGVMNGLQLAGIAHGDLQHGNILINGEQIRLVDYDGMYVPALSGRSSLEIGHRNYQHPARDKTKFGPWLDNFSAWLIYQSVKIISIDPSIWQRFEGGDECILWRQFDLQDPMHSELFFTLENHDSADIRKSSAIIRHFLSLQIEHIPALEENFELQVKLEPIPKQEFRKQTRLSDNQRKSQTKDDESKWWKDKDSTGTHGAQGKRGGRAGAYGSQANPGATAGPNQKHRSVLKTAYNIGWCGILLYFISGGGNLFHQPSDTATQSDSQQTPTLQQKLATEPFTNKFSLLLQSANLHDHHRQYQVAQQIYSTVDAELSKTPQDKLSAMEKRYLLLAKTGITRTKWQIESSSKHLDASDNAWLQYGDPATAGSFKRGERLLSGMEYEPAYEEFKRIADKNPHFWSVDDVSPSGICSYQLNFMATLYQKLGKCQEGMHQTRAAIESYKQATTIYRNILESRLAICILAEKSGDLPYAREEYEWIAANTKPTNQLNDIYEFAFNGLNRVERELAKQKQGATSKANL